MSQASPDLTPAAEAPELSSTGQRFRESWHRLGDALEKEPQAHPLHVAHAAPEDPRDVQDWKPFTYTTLADLSGRVKHLADQFPEAGDTLGELHTAFTNVAAALRRDSKPHEQLIEYPLDAYKGILERHGKKKAKLWQSGLQKIASDFQALACVTREAITVAHTARNKRERDEEVAALAEEQKEGQKEQKVA